LFRKQKAAKEGSEGWHESSKLGNCFGEEIVDFGVDLREM